MPEAVIGSHKEENPEKNCYLLRIIFYIRFDKLGFIVFLNCLFFQDFQTMPTLSMCYKEIESIFRNVLDFFVNYIYINHIRPKTLFLQ